MSSAPPRDTRKIHISVLNQDPLRFVGLRSILEAEPDFLVEPLDLSSFDHPLQSEVVLLGVQSTPALSDLIVKVRMTSPSARIILTGGPGHDEPIIRAIASGIRGYLDDMATGEDYKNAIRVVAGGSMWAPRRVMARFIERVTANPRSALNEASGLLSDREMEVLELLVHGYTNKEIALQMGIEERTVKSHITKLMQKTGAANRIGLSVYALKSALLSS